MSMQMQNSGLVIPFPDIAYRALRAQRQGDGPRGEILLFTGIRYERQIAPQPQPTVPGTDTSDNDRPRTQ